MIPPSWLHIHAVVMCKLQQIAVRAGFWLRENASTAKCTQLACVTFNYCSSTFHETVIEPGAVPLFKTTGFLQFALCPLKAPSLLISTSRSLPVGPDGGIAEMGLVWVRVLQASLGHSDNTLQTHTHTPPNSLPSTILTRIISPSADLRLQSM